MDIAVGQGLSRRQMLGMAGALAAVGVAPRLFTGLPRLGLWPGGGGHEAFDLTLEAFAPHVGSRFLVRTDGMHRRAVTLVEATARQSRPRDRRGLVGESFSLVFAGDGPKAFEHGTRAVSHPALGTFPLFLVSVGQGRAGPRYQAVVDRRRASG